MLPEACARVAVVRLWTLGAQSKTVVPVVCRGMGSPEVLTLTKSLGLLDGSVCLGLPGTQALELSCVRTPPLVLTSYAILGKFLNLFGPQFPRL